MACAVCEQRKGRRECPALGRTICPVCCGTKRLTEIHCPADCVYLASAREHPAAVVRRQQERDLAVLLPTIRNLTERQYQLFFLFHSVIARHRPDGFTRLVDEDVADGAGSLAATLETAGRGVIYEHAAQTLPGQRLASDLKGLLTDIRKRGATVYDHEAAVALRAIEEGARETRQSLGGESPYLEIMARLLVQQPAPTGQTTDTQPDARSTLILP
jgi:hypothetical protein